MLKSVKGKQPGAKVELVDFGIMYPYFRASGETLTAAKEWLKSLRARISAMAHV